MISNERKSHIRISLLTDRAGPRLKTALAVFADLAVGVFALIFAYKGWRLVSNNLGIETVTLFFDFWVVYLIVPLSALATQVIVGCDLAALRRGQSTTREIIL